MEVSRLYLDSNILIALGEGAGDVANLLTDLALQHRPGEIPFLCTSELTLSEILVQPYREGNNELVDKYDGWLTSATFLDVGPVDRSALWYAAAIRSQFKSIKLPDAIHVSTAIGFGCSHMLTADLRLSDVSLDHVRYGIERGPASLRVIRPTADTLRQIISQRSF